MTTPSLFTFLGDTPPPPRQPGKVVCLLSELVYSPCWRAENHPPFSMSPWEMHSTIFRISGKSLLQSDLNLLCCSLSRGDAGEESEMGITDKPIASFLPSLPVSQSGLRDTEWLPRTLLLSTHLVLNKCLLHRIVSLFLPICPPTPNTLPPPAFPSLSLTPHGFLLPLPVVPSVICPVSIFCLCLVSPSPLNSLNSRPIAPLIKKKKTQKKCQTSLELSRSRGREPQIGGRKRDQLSWRRPLRGIEEVYGHLAKLGPPFLTPPTLSFS